MTASIPTPSISASRDPDPGRSESDARRWWPWAAVAALLLLLCLAWFVLPLRAWMDALQSWLLGLGAGGVVLLAVIIVLVTFLPAPDWPLPIAAGYIYGFWAIPLVYVSVAFASTLAFLAARYVGRERVRSFLRRRPKYRALDKAVAEEGWQVVLLARLSPMVPFNLQNYAFGVTAIPFRQYLGATLVGIVPGIAIYVYFGVFGQGLGKGVGPLDWALFAVGIAATIALGWLVTRKAKTKLAESGNR